MVKEQIKGLTEEKKGEKKGGNDRKVLKSAAAAVVAEGRNLNARLSVVVFVGEMAE